MSKKKLEKESKYIDNRIDEVSGNYVQFSKKFVLLCILNLVMIEIFAMVMIFKTNDTSQISYLITSIAATCLSVGIFYMKNSESEKKARINAEIERMKLEGINVGKMHMRDVNSSIDSSYVDTIQSAVNTDALITDDTYNNSVG